MNTYHVADVSRTSSHLILTKIQGLLKNYSHFFQRWKLHQRSEVTPWGHKWQSQMGSRSACQHRPELPGRTQPPLCPALSPRLQRVPLLPPGQPVPRSTASGSSPSIKAPSPSACSLMRHTTAAAHRLTRRGPRPPCTAIAPPALQIPPPSCITYLVPFYSLLAPLGHTLPFRRS